MTVQIQFRDHMGKNTQQYDLWIESQSSMFDYEVVKTVKVI